MIRRHSSSKCFSLRRTKSGYFRLFHLLFSCHLAPFSSWPDRIKFLLPWSSHLHYVNPVDDEPPKHCTYGENGWQDRGTGNVLEGELEEQSSSDGVRHLFMNCKSLAIVNYTSRVATTHGYERDVALRFLTHYMGDAHQPLHLTGRARGGNDIAVRFEGRYAKLHSVWDGLLINAQIRQLANYTTRLPSARIESALRGTRYDAYIRWILVEGLGQGKNSSKEGQGWWAEEQGHWTTCPSAKKTIQEDGPINSSAHWLRTITPQSSKLADRIFSMRFRKMPDAVHKWRPDDVDETDLPVCPYSWTKPMHPLVCSYAFADPIPAPGQEHNGSLAELDVPEYKGRIENDKVIQKQLALAGVRLAAILNSLLLPEALMSQDTSSSPSFSYISTKDASIQEEEKKRKKKDKRHGGSQSPILGLVKVTAESIAEVIILSSVGYILARQGILDKKTQTKINKLNVSFFTPALLFSKVAFTLNPARLAELIIVPAGFVIITVISCIAALILSWTANLSKSQRNFSIACAITPNSNSLPVALMQSLVVTVPQLHWEEEGEPEDTVSGMLGRSLTYLVLFSTLGMFLRWSVASQLLSTMDDEEVKIQEPEIQTGRLIDYDDENEESGTLTPATPRITIRRSTEEGGVDDPAVPATLTAETIPEGPAARRSSKSRQGPPAWAISFPNSPSYSNSDSGSENGNETNALLGGEVSPQEARKKVPAALYKFWNVVIVKPFFAVTSFMTMPLYAAVISLVVALIPPLQKVVASVEPVVGALETAGACSIPLTMVVLGAYFYQEAEMPTDTPVVSSTRDDHRHTQGSASLQTQSPGATLVGKGTSTKRNSIPWMRNPWSRDNNSSKASSRNGSVDDYTSSGAEGEETADEDRTAQQALAQQNARINSGDSSWFGTNNLTAAEKRQKKIQTMERRTIAVAVASRMLFTPLILMPFLAYYAIATSENVMDDPVFITCACLLVGSPPALTLAQITSQSAKGSNSSFERLISKTIFVSYAVLAAPTTILLVLAALLIAEND